MRFVSRREWGAAYAQGSGAIPGPVLGVTCHWEGPHMGAFPHSACATKVRVIERFHAVTRGWSGVAYNALVCPHGYVFEGRGAGVRSAANGTSSIGGNDQWYAVCYLGGQGDPFTADGRTGMADAIGWLRTAGNAGPRVNGHRDHHATECPGDVIYRWVRSGIPPEREPVLEEPDMQLSDKVGKADDAPTVGQILHRLDRYMANSAQREKRVLASLRGAADEIAAAVAAELRGDLEAGGGITPEQLRRIVYAQASNAINNRLGSLNDEGK